MDAKEDYAIRQSEATTVAGFEHLSKMISERLSHDALDLADTLLWTTSNSVYDCWMWGRKPNDVERKIVRDICDKLSQQAGIGDGKAVENLIKWAEKTMEECDGTE